MAGRGDLPQVVPVTRPGIGRKGRPVKLLANHYAVELDPNVVVFQYSVQFWPSKRPLKGKEMQEGGASATPPAFNRLVMSYFLETYKNQMGNGLYAYDGRRSLFSITKLEFTEEMSFEFTIEEESGKKEDMTLHIIRAGFKSVSELMSALQTPGRDIPNEVIQALDISLRENLLKRFVLSGRTLFSARNCEALGEGCSAWRGIYQSLRPTVKGFTLNVELKFTAFYDEQNLIDFAKSAMNFPDQKPFPRTLQDRDRRLVAKALKGVRVQSSHTGKKMKHQVHDITTTPANRIMFESNGKTISVADYFEDTYKIRLRYPQLQCAKVHRKRDIFLPLELLSVAAQKRAKALTPKQTQKVVRIAAVKPQDRRRGLEERMKEMDLNKDPLVQSMGLKVLPKLVQVQARILNAPSVLYGGQERVNPRDGTWNMKGKTFLNSGQSLSSWGLLNFCMDRDADDRQVDSFIGKLTRVMKENGIQVRNSRPLIRRANPRNAEQEMIRMKDTLDQDSPAQLILCIKRDQDAGLYNAIKKTSDCVLGIPSQCMLSKHIQKGDIQYCSNISLKINAKLGGRNSFPEPFADRELNHRIEAAPFMLIGADVTHPAPGARGVPSIAAMVGTIDRQMTRFASSLRNQASRKETIEDAQGMFLELVNEFQKANRGAKPMRIVFYRDGVSEGQFQQILDFELWELRKACMRIAKDYRPPMTIVTVQKRHNTRFFPMDPKDGDRSGNVRAGTVVDRDVVHPKFYDFFLNSHGGLQGTSKPGLYTVLHDENQFTPDQMQHFTYRMCHNYARCCKSVGVVGAAYYAHHLAFRGRCFLGDVDSDYSSEGSAVPSSSIQKPVSAGVHKNLSATLFYV